MEIPTPQTIFCPRCGNVLSLERITEARTQVELESKGFVVGARGMCPCGVTAVLAMKRMPENPTFTLMFNIYKLELNNRREV